MFMHVHAPQKPHPTPPRPLPLIPGAFACDTPPPCCSISFCKQLRCTAALLLRFIPISCGKGPERGEAAGYTRSQHGLQDCQPFQEGTRRSSKAIRRTLSHKRIILMRSGGSRTAPSKTTREYNTAHCTHMRTLPRRSCATSLCGSSSRSGEQVPQTTLPHDLQ